MSLEAHTAIVRRFIEELWNERRLALADELFAADCVTHQLKSGADVSGVPRGPEAMKHHVAEWLAAFPDIRFTIEQMLAEGDRVMTQCVARGTHLGSWLGIPATGKFISIQMAVVHRIADGLIAEDWVLVDSLGVFSSLAWCRRPKSSSPRPVVKQRRVDDSLGRSQTFAREHKQLE